MEENAGKGVGVGFLKSFRARHAEEAIDRSEGLLTVLRLTQADFKPAEHALEIAKELYKGQQYARALSAARQAEALAITLDERHNGYQKAAAGLRDCMEAMRKVGLRTEDLEAVLGRAEEKVLAGIWENGAFVPNYLEARVLVESAEREGRTLLERATSASNAIFLAELGIEALADMKGPSDPKVFSEGATTELEDRLEEATRKLAQGDIEGATKVARDLEDRARNLKTGYIEASRILTATELHLSNLRGEGIATERIERQIETARNMLNRGLIVPGVAMTRRLASEAQTLGDAYRKATTGLGDAEVLYEQLSREGFQSYEADAAIRDARKAIREGNYPKALEHLQRAHLAFVRRRNVRETLAKALEETKARVAVLKDSGLAFIPDIQEVLGRAEREFKDGNYSGSSEDLRIATLLLGQPGRPSGKQG